MMFKADFSNKDDDRRDGDKDADVDDISYDLNVPGRVVLNLWRIFRHKVKTFLC